MALLVAIAIQPRADQISETTSSVFASPTELPTATTNRASTTATTSQPERQPPLTPEWEFVGEGDRVGGVMFGTGKELIVWGGRAFPVGVEDGPFLHTGIAWNHLTGATRTLPVAPFSACRGTNGAVWTGQELVVWFRAYADPGCREGVVAAYDPVSDQWREVDAPEFIEAGISATWTGKEILAWKRGLALDPETGTVRKFDPLEINESHHSRANAHWTGQELLVLGGARLFRYRIETDSWDLLQSPPIGSIAQASVWTGERLLTVNYEMEAALFEPERKDWLRIESMPLRFWETIPSAVASDELAIVKMGSASAVLDGTSWVAMPDAALGWDTPHAEGALVIADNWLYQVGNFVVRRPLPVTVGGGVQTEDVIPLQTMLFDVPSVWTARLVPIEEGKPGYGDRHAYQLTANEMGTCRVEAWHGGELPTALRQIYLARSWDGAGMQVGTDLANKLAVVDDSERTSDWVAIRCDSNENSHFLASHIRVSR